MSAGHVTTMDAIEIEEFLAGQQAGVIAMPGDGECYAIPVSFAYDADGPDIYLRLGFGPDSQKRAFVDAAESVSFVVYDRTDAGWRSVVARGRIEELSRTSLDSTVEEAVRGLDIPFFSVFAQPAADLDFGIFRIDVGEVKGIVEGSGR